MSWSGYALMAAVASVLCMTQAESQPLAYITNEASGTVSIVDTRLDKVTSTFEAGDHPLAIAASRDGARLYIGHRTGTLIERDLYEDRESARTTVGGSAKAIRRSPTGNVLSAVLEDSDVVALIDMPTLRVTRAIHIGGKHAEDAVFSPDGRWLYANATHRDSVSVIDVAKGSVIDSIRVGGDARSIAFLPDGSRAYVTVTGTNELAVIDVPRRAVVARIRSTTALDDVAVQPDGKRVFIAIAGTPGIRVLDAGSNRFIADIEVGASVSGMAFTSDGGKLYVACRGSDEVSVIDTSTYRRIATIHVGAQPSAIVIADRPNLPRDGG